MPLIELTDVTKRYQVGEQEIYALNGIDLSIEQGEYAAIIGPSGSGKSTLMHLLGCLDTPSSGRMMIDGIDVSPGERQSARRDAQPEDRLRFPEPSICSRSSPCCKTWSCR